MKRRSLLAAGSAAAFGMTAPAVPHPGRRRQIRSRPDRDRRHQVRRIGLHRQRDRRQCLARRPHGRPGRDGADVRGAGDARPEAADQRRHRSHPDRQCRGRLQPAGVRKARAVPYRTRADRACEKESRQAFLCVVGKRYVAASRCGAFREDGRREAAACALSRRRAGDPGYGRRHMRHDVRQHAGVPGPDQRWRPGPDRLRLTAALAAVPQRAADLADRARLYGGELVRRVGAEGASGRPG